MAIKGKFFALPWSCFSFNVAKMDTIIIATLMMDVKAYSDERSTNKNNPSVRIIIKSFDKRTGFICIGSIHKGGSLKRLKSMVKPLFTVAKIPHNVTQISR